MDVVGAKERFNAVGVVPLTERQGVAVEFAGKIDDGGFVGVRGIHVFCQDGVGVLAAVAVPNRFAHATEIVPGA